VPIGKRWSKKTDRIKDFMKFKKIPNKKMDILTNPPFVRAKDFVETSMKLLRPGRKLALLLRLSFLEGQRRKLMFEKYPPKYVFVFSARLPRMHLFKYKGHKGSSLMAFAWFVWEKNYKGPTVVEWL
jgi:hypothetical protein